MRTNDVLDQIDACLGDYSVSDDAMRCAPDLPAPAVRPRANGRNVLVQRLIEGHNLSDEQACAAVLAAERGQDSEHARLAAMEAQVAFEELAAQVREAFRPMLQHVTEQFSKIREAFQHLPEAAGCNDCGSPVPRRDRPAWQSPYGPARQRR